MNFHRLIYNLMPISEADIIKPFIERDQLNRKTKATSGQKTGNGKKSDELDEILEEREQIPVLDIEKLVIEKLEAKIGQSIPFHEYKAKMPDLCYYAVHGHVTKLRIRKANLTCIPDLIKELKNLEILDLQHNHIAVVPESVGELFQLEELNLSYNDLQGLPDIFHGLKKLNQLYLGHNKFQEFPITICKSRNLKELEISNNQISVIPVNIREMENLQTVDITENLIQALDRDTIYYGRAVISWKKDNKMDSTPKEGQE